MRLEVIGGAALPGDHSVSNYIDVNHGAVTDVTTVEINCDIVTLGIAAKVLTEKYEQFRRGLPSGLSAQLDKAIKEALANA